MAKYARNSRPGRVHIGSAAKDKRTSIQPRSTSYPGHTNGHDKETHAVGANRRGRLDGVPSEPLDYSVTTRHVIGRWRFDVRCWRRRRRRLFVLIFDVCGGD